LSSDKLWEQSEPRVFLSSPHSCLKPSAHRMPQPNLAQTSSQSRSRALWSPYRISSVVVVAEQTGGREKTCDELAYARKRARGSSQLDDDDFCINTMAVGFSLFDMVMKQMGRCR